MQKFNLINILRFVKKPSRLLVMVKKVGNRIFDKSGNNENYKSWIEEFKTPFDKYAENLDPEIWNESKAFLKLFEAESNEKLSKLKIKLGGGGIYPLLYFIVRKIKPETIVETGVAAGFSSQAFLKALSLNEKGKLFSSDFPYFRVKNPEQYIGIVVEESLKTNWTLYIEGDQINIPKILSEIQKIDIFHYDSDKTYSSRAKTLKMVLPKMKKNGIILIDDIQDNSHFMDYILSNNISSWRVFEFKGKYIGMIGDVN